MNLLRAVILVVLALGFQVALVRVWPEAHRCVDALLVPVGLYGISGSQLSAMLVGCASGLLHDSWFQVGVFGLSGFKRTLLGWTLGLAASRLDLGHPAGRLVTGVALSLGDNLLDPPLLRLLDSPPQPRAASELALHALLTGLLTALAGGLVARVGGGPRARGRPV